MNNVLFIAYQIPPIAGPAAQRHLRFLSNLYDFGWNPIVLTVDPEYSEDYYNKDPSLMDCLDKNIRIHRTKAYNPMDRFLERRKANQRREGLEKFCKAESDTLERIKIESTSADFERSCF